MKSLLDIASQAAVSARRRLGIVPGDISQMDWDEWVGAASLGIAKALHWHPDASEAYLVGAGRRETICWFIRSWSRSPRAQSLDWDDGEEKFGLEEIGLSSDWQPSPAQMRSLWYLLYQSRSKKGLRGELATDRDIAIIVCLLRGWGNAEIGRELGVPAGHIKKYRQQLVRRLEKIAEAAQQQDMPCSAGSEREAKDTQK